jgi:hypothetical protein
MASAEAIFLLKKQRLPNGCSSDTILVPRYCQLLAVVRLFATTQPIVFQEGDFPLVLAINHLTAQRRRQPPNKNEIL